jgi:hypothetical protein
MEGSVEVVSTMGKDKGAIVTEAQSEAGVDGRKGRSSERFGWRRFGTGRPGDEGGMEVGGAGYSYEGK